LRTRHKPGLGITVSLLLTVPLTFTACASPAANSGIQLTASASPVVDTAERTGKIVADLKKIAAKSQLEMQEHGLTEIFYVNSNTDPRPFTGRGSNAWTVAYNSLTKQWLSRYPTNPSYREKGAGPQAVRIALETAAGYSAGDPTPIENSGSFTFTMKPADNEVVVVKTSNGLVKSVLIEDRLSNPSFTNLYEIHAYDTTNALAKKVLFTRN